MQMIKTSSLSISILGTVLSAASLTGAQNVKPAEPTAIQELALRPQPLLAARILFQVNPAAPPVIQQQGLSRYGEFQLGMNLLSVAKLAGMKPSEARMIQQRPATIQELEWLPQNSLASSSRYQAIDEVLFSFYDGQLFRMVVHYDQRKTEGQTDEDMIEAISAKYGTPTRPAAQMILFSSFQVYNDREKGHRAVGGFAVLIQSFSFFLPTHFWNADFFEAAGPTGSVGYRRSDPNGRARGSSTRNCTSKARRGRPVRAREGQAGGQRGFSPVTAPKQL
jgi:hypothetical protein